MKHALRSLRRSIVATALLLALSASIASARDARAHEHSPIVYVGAVIANVFYMPAKIVFAATGAVTSGVAYLVTFGDRKATDAVWRSATGGTYVLTPRMIEGRAPVRFIGR